MSLYYEAARFLDTTPQSSSLKSRVYSAKDLKSSAAQIHGLCIEATRWSPVLSDVIEKAGVLEAERKLTPALALLLAYDVLIGKRVSARKDHVLSLAINRHKARLNAEFTRARIHGGQPSIDAWKRALLEDGKLTGGSSERGSHPRWVRVNTLLSTSDAECEQETGVFHGWQQVSSLADLTKGAEPKKYYVDEHVPSLFATPPGSEAHLTKTLAYRQGRIILQDKASCFPAYLLFSAPWAVVPKNSTEEDGSNLRLQQTGNIIDACAAPGNKTTHLAALAMAAYGSKESTMDRTLNRPKITAVERDKMRATTLAHMVKTAGADKDGLVTCLQGQDFSRLNPEDKKWQKVTALLLDPSCSGSGIVGRDQGEDESPEGAVKLVLPLPAASRPSTETRGARNRKKLNGGDKKDRGKTVSEQAEKLLEGDEETSEQTKADLQKRLHGLQGFQLSLLTHAFRFPAARKVVYSTCSIHAEENEQVVARALSSKVAQSRGWRIMTRAEQIDGMKRWHVRGNLDAFSTYDLPAEWKSDMEIYSPEVLADACIRCEKGTTDGTMGFFAVAFVRSDESGGQLHISNGTGHESHAAEDEVEEEAQEEGDSFEGFDD